MVDEPDSLILRLLREMRAEMATGSDIRDVRGAIGEIRSDLARVRAQIADVIANANSLRADVASDLLVMRRELTEQIVGLRRAVVDYHTSVVGHGVLISDLDARLRRVEQRLDLPPMTAG